MRTLAVIVGAGLLGVASQADATIYLALQASGVNGGALTQIGSDGGTGSLGYTGFNYGGFVSNISAQGVPTLPSPNLQSSSVNTQSNAAGVLTIYITQTDLTPFSGNLLSSFTSNSILNFGTGAASVSEYTYVDPTNGLFGGTEMANASFNSIGATTKSVAQTLTAPFSETTKYVVNIGAGGGSVNDTINISGAGAVPEPASWAMMLVGFGFIGASLRQRRRAAVSFG